MEIGRRATAPDMQNALVPGSENSRWYGEWVADDLDTARAVDTCNSLLVRCPARAPAHTCHPRGSGSQATSRGAFQPRTHTVGHALVTPASWSTGHEPCDSVVVRLFGDPGAQLGKDFLFGFRAGMKLAQAFIGLTDIVESGVDTVQFHALDRGEQ